MFITVADLSVEGDNILKAECFSVLCLLKHLHKVSLRNLGPSSLILGYCEMPIKLEKHSPAHLPTKLPLSSHIALFKDTHLRFCLSFQRQIKGVFLMPESRLVLSTG